MLDIILSVFKLYNLEAGSDSIIKEKNPAWLGRLNRSSDCDLLHLTGPPEYNHFTFLHLTEVDLLPKRCIIHTPMAMASGQHNNM